MILSDSGIIKAVAEELIEVDPWRVDQINPASYDVTLAPELMVPEFSPMLSRRNQAVQARWLDLADVAKQPPYLHEVTMRNEHDGTLHPYLIEPGEFLLASTVERITLGGQTAARIEGKSSLARVGLAVHVTGGFIDPGFSGQITLEIVNMLHRPLMLHAGMRIAQVAFLPVMGEVVKPYSRTGRYNNQTGPTLSRFRVDRVDEGA